MSAFPVAAATVTGTFTVSTTVQATCAITAGALTFGTYGGVLINSNSTMSVTCPNTTPYTIGLNAGGRQRKQHDHPPDDGPGAATLAYKMFRDAAYTQNGQRGRHRPYGGTGNGVTQALTVYGQIAGGQAVTPGPYADTVTATVTY